MPKNSQLEGGVIGNKTQGAYVVNDKFTANVETLQSDRMTMEHKLKTADRGLIKLTKQGEHAP